jgi:hypothetical protein
MAIGHSKVNKIPVSRRPKEVFWISLVEEVVNKPDKVASSRIIGKVNCER